MAENVKHDIANNNDLLMEVLACLPANSILRFKSVSKLWFSIISSPVFCRRRFSHHYVSGLLLRGPEDYNPGFDLISLDDMLVSPPFRSLVPDDDGPSIEIHQSCNGLLLCCSSLILDFLPVKYYVWNPTTRQFFLLPHPGGDDAFESVLDPKFGIRMPRKIIVSMSLAFDPAKLAHYKVICIQECKPKKGFKMDKYVRILIYSSETHTWKLSGDPFSLFSDVLSRSGVFCNGAIHWICSLGDHTCFIVDDEDLYGLPDVPIPEGCERKMTAYFGESQGHLHLVEIYKPLTTRFDIFEIEEDYSQWFVKYSVDPKAFTTAFPNMISSNHDPSHLLYYLFNVLCVVWEERDEESYLVFDIPCAIMRYNLKEKTFRKICDYSRRNYTVDSFRPSGWWEVHKLVESLSCV